MDDLMKSGLLTDDALRQAIADGILGKNTCPYLQFYDITIRTDAQINALWHLGTYTEFTEHYAEQIREKVGDGEFKLGKLRYTLTDRNELVPAQQMLPTEQFYDFERDDLGIPKKVRFSNVHLLEFMQNRGFYRFKELDQSFTYIQIEDGLIDRLNTIALRDYVNDYLSGTEHDNIMLRNFFCTTMSSI
jgi:TFIIF-interacting CTD phosphatase-like protein